MTIGIYCITNTRDNKRYIGKSINIERRIYTHKNTLTKRPRNKKQTNRYLYAAVQKYGIDCFEFSVLEELSTQQDDILCNREIFWMDYYQTCNRNFGYNLRRDSSTASVVHEETRRLLSQQTTGSRNPNYGNFWTDEKKQAMSELKKEQIRLGLYSWMQSPEWRLKMANQSKTTWSDPKKKAQMVKKVASSKSMYRFYQFSKVTGSLVRIWESMWDIKQIHPTWHEKAIYSVCNGTKKSYRGFLWTKELKIS